MTRRERTILTAAALLCALMLVMPTLRAQLQQSGGPGSSVTLQAGSALAGKFGIDQTTPGTTNAIAVAQIGATTVATGNGVTGAGSQRVTIASDQTAFSVNAAQSGANFVRCKVARCW